MTEKDLGLKADIRRLMWRMGMSTRIDVPLRSYVAEGASRTRAGVESYTDLDVLGVAIGRDTRVQTAIADCKTSPGRSTERMFWIRGVADFFNADDAYMVRSGQATGAARQLAARLGVAVLTSEDLILLESYHSTHLDFSDPSMSFLFDGDAIARYRHALTEIDARLRPLAEFKEFDYWVYEQHRNLMQVVAHLSDASRHLSPQHPIHVALFYECAWLYALSIAHAVEHIRRTHVSDIDTSLREYLFGGQLGLREKRALAQVLDEAAGLARPLDAAVFPDYYPALLEIVTRVLRRPGRTITSLRYGEWLAEVQMAKVGLPLRKAFGNSYDEVAAKLLGDVASFLVTSAHLNQGFRDRARSELLLLEPLAQAERVRRARTSATEKDSLGPANRPATVSSEAPLLPLESGAGPAPTPDSASVGIRSDRQSVDTPPPISSGETKVKSDPTTAEEVQAEQR